MNLRTYLATDERSKLLRNIDEKLFFVLNHNSELEALVIFLGFFLISLLAFDLVH